ncbi:MAG: ABC exporter membrane fusion protein [Cyanomargarita calcarea GSE-NOS-MK-12-04C]|jgi:HlyD family secretion protein|uniref:ABC exporter membrane fusion protein n=1 Tax=Cyanomargarita calcarea GSE-NOS-MK-12-04C TaxID=2839659 RepID=A0A951QSM0_9CYAN|nr:ABC exporter membrane fusion protein [Cyanomargarita calcarea GSE-NOS-MK-12-04C]
MTFKLLLKPKNPWLIGLLVGATAITGGVIFYGVSQFGFVAKTPSSQTVEAAPIVKKVTALGRLEPSSQVIKLSAPLALDGDRISQTLVKEGDRVKAGQVIVILDSRDRLLDAHRQAEKQVGVAKAKLKQVQAGAKTGDIQAQKAKIATLEAQTLGDKTERQEAIARLEAQWFGDRIAQEATINKLAAELSNAEAEFRRYQQLNQEGAISKSLYDSKRLSLDTARQQLGEAKAVLNRINATAIRQVREAKIALSRINSTGSKQVTEAQGTLSSIAEVRGVDVQAAQMEVENAVAAMKRAQTDLDQAYIKAPMAGQIIKIHTRVGEKISDNGIADLAQNDQMVAVAEVYQTDISKVKLGQQAVVTSQAFEGEVRGTVSQVGLQVNRQNVFASQPGENMDRRVIEVKIHLDPEASKRVAGFTNLQVQTAIEL